MVGCTQPTADNPQETTAPQVPTELDNPPNDVLPPISSLSDDEILNYVNEVMSSFPGFQFRITEHIRAEEDDTKDIMTMETEGEGKPGDDLLQRIHFTGDYLSLDGITIETRIVCNQAYNLNPVTGTWDIVAGSPYESDSPVVMLLNGQLILEDMQILDEGDLNKPACCIIGNPQGESSITSIKMWIDPFNYFASKLEIASSTPLSQPPWNGLLIQEWELQPLEEAVTVNIPDGLPPPVSMLPSTTIIEMPDTNQLLDMILKQLSPGMGQYNVVAPTTNVPMLYFTELLNIEEEHKFSEYIIQRLNKGDYDFSELVNQLLELNREPISLTLTSSQENGYLIDYDDEFNRYPKQDPMVFWEQWHEDNPQAFGYAHISIPVTDARTGYVLVYVDVSWGALAASGDIITYRYWEGKLYRTDTVNTFKS